MAGPYLAGSGSAASGGSAKLTVPITNAIASGDTIQVGIAVTNSAVTISSVTDTQSNTYLNISAATNTHQTGAATCQVYVYTVVASTGLTTSDSVIVKYSSNASNLGAIVIGDHNVSAIDSASSNSASNAGSSTIAVAVPATGTLAQAQENIITFSVAGETLSSSSSQTFSTAGTFSFTTGTGITSVNITAIGGGGGGGCGYIGSDYSASGGGGGGSATTTGVTVTASHLYSNCGSVGSGGAGGDYSGGADGSAGTSSTITLGSTTVAASGGGQGYKVGYNQQGAGGTGTTGTHKYSGGNGGYSLATGPSAYYGDYGGGGGGSAGATGAGGNGTNGGTVGYSQRGAGGTAGASGGADGGAGGNASSSSTYPYMSGGNGVAPGGGGGGGGNNNGNTGVGGNGATGAVIISWAGSSGTNFPTWTSPSGITSLANVDCNSAAALSASYVQVIASGGPQITPTATLGTSAVWAAGSVADEVTEVSSATILPNGIYNIAYSQSLVSTGGTSPYTYAVTGGSLPTGLSLTGSGGSAGLISGTPSSSTGGTYTFTISITDSSIPAAVGTYTASITIVARTTQNISAAALPLPNNILSLNDSDFETGIGTWTAGSNASGVAQNTNTSLTGSACAHWTATAGGSPTYITSGYYKCTSSSPYIFSGYLLPNGAYDCCVGVNWYTSGHVQIGSMTLGPSDPAVSTRYNWQPVQLATTSPSNAAYFKVVAWIGQSSTGDNCFADLMYATQSGFQVLIDFLNNTFTENATAISSGSSFMDVSPFVRMDTGMTISRGRQDSISEIQAGTATVLLENDSGTFTEYVTNSVIPAYGGVMTLSRRMQFNICDELGNWHTRYDGITAGYNYTFDNVGYTSSIAITGTDVMAVLNRAVSMSSWTNTTVLNDGPLYHWALDDAGNSVGAPQQGTFDAASAWTNFGIAVDSSGNNGPSLSLTKAYGASASISWQDTSGGIESLADAVQAEGPADGSEYWTPGSDQPNSLIRGLDSRVVGPYTTPMGSPFFTPDITASAVPSTSVASTSNGGEISAIASWASPSVGELDVADTTGYPASGLLNVAASGPTTAIISYTGVTGSAFTGCVYISGSATGTVNTGNTVDLRITGTQNTFVNNAGYQLNGQFKNVPMELDVSGNVYTVEAWFTMDPTISIDAGLACGPFTIIGLGSSRKKWDILNSGIYLNSSTTINSASNGGLIQDIASWAAPSAGVLDVEGTAGFTSTGQLYVTTTASPGVIAYTGTTSTSFTGCTYIQGSGTVATGGNIVGVPNFAVATYNQPPSFAAVNNAQNATTELVSAYSPMFLETVPLPHHLVMVFTAGTSAASPPTVTTYLDTNLVDTIDLTYGTTYDTICIGGSYGGFGNHYGNIQLVSIYQYGLSTRQILQHCQMGQYGMWEETSDDTIARLAELANIPPFWNNTVQNHNGLMLMDYLDITNSNALTNMQYFEQAENGTVYVNAQGQLAFQTGDWRFGHGAPDMYLGPDTFDATELQWNAVDQFLINEAGVSSQIYQSGAGWVNNGSQDLYGIYSTNPVSSPLQLPLISWARAYAQLGLPQLTYWPDPYLADMAQWQANHAANPYFFPSSVEVDLYSLSKGESNLGVSDFYQIEIGNMIAPEFNATGIGSQPVSWPNTTGSMEWFVEGVTETISLTTHTVQFYTSPANAQRAWRPGDPTYGQLGITSMLGLSQADISTPQADGKDVSHDAGPPYWPPVFTGSPINRNFAFEASYQPWTALTSGTTLLISTAWSLNGPLPSNYSAVFNGNGSVSGPGIISESTIIVTPLTYYSAAAVVYSPQGWASGVEIKVTWLTSGGSTISSVTSSAVAVTAGVTAGTTVTSAGLQAPSNAAYAEITIIMVGTPSSTVQMYVGRAYITQGPEITPFMNNPAQTGHGFIGSRDIRGLHDNLQLLLNPPMAIVGQQGSTQTVSSGANTIPEMFYDTNMLDTEEGFGVIPGWPNWYVCVVPGFYDIDASWVWANSTTNASTCQAWIIVAQQAAQAVTAGIGTPETVTQYVYPVGEEIPINTFGNSAIVPVTAPTTRIYLGLGDMVSMGGQQNSGAATSSGLGIVGGSDFSLMFRGYSRTDDRTEINSSISTGGSVTYTQPAASGQSRIYTNLHTYSYTGNTCCTPNTLRAKDGNCWQGMYGGGYYTEGSQSSLISFPASSIASDWAGQTVSSVTLTCTNLHTWYDAGGYIMLGYTTTATPGKTYDVTTGTSSPDSPDIMKQYFIFGQTLTFTLPLSFATAFISGGANSLLLGDNSTQDLNFYGYWQGGPGTWTLTVNGTS